MTTIGLFLFTGLTTDYQRNAKLYAVSTTAIVGGVACSDDATTCADDALRANRGGAGGDLSVAVSR